MTESPPDQEALLSVWLQSQLLIRACGRTWDLDAPSLADWPAPLARLQWPITLVTAWNPGGREADGPANRAANRALRAAIERRGWAWRPALGRARDGSWAEPGFAVGGLDAAQAAALGREWGQLAVYFVTPDEIAVLASDGSFRRTRPRGQPPTD